MEGHGRGVYLQEITIDGKTYRYRDNRTSIDDDTINMRELGMGFSARQVEYSITPTVEYTIKLDPSKKSTAKGILMVYQRPYSVVHSLLLPNYYDRPNLQFNPGCETSATAASCKLNSYVSINTFGQKTSEHVIENFAKNNQKFSYSGEAFTIAAVPEKGVFNYQVDFGFNGLAPRATGSGSITGFKSVGDITLGSNGVATESREGRIGNYSLTFFGPNAEEVAGDGLLRDAGKDGTDVRFGFSGAR